MSQDPFWTAEDTESPPLAPVVTAAFEGPCSVDCGSMIEEGDDIRSDGAGGWVHADCAEGVA